MEYLPENVRKALEQYIKGERQEAFEALIPGSEYHSYITIVDSLKHCKGKVDKRLKDMISRFKKNWPGFESERLELQSYLIEYDTAMTEQEKKDLIKEIDTNFVHGYYEFAKPAEIKGVKEKRVRDRSKSPGKRKVNNVFIQEKYYSEESTLKKVYKNDFDLSSLQRSLLNKVDYTKVSDKSFLMVLNLCPYLSEISTPSFMTKLVTYMKNNYKVNKHYMINQTHLDNLTAEQLEELGSKCPLILDDKNFVGKTFEKRFHFELDDHNKENFSLEDRRAQLISMFEASEHRPQSFKSTLLLAILENGLKLDIYDKKYFILYLENPLKMWHMNKKRGTKDCQDFTWNPYIQNLQLRQGGVMSSELEGNMYKKYLEKFYRDSGDLKELQDYFSDIFLKSLVEEFHFFAGNSIPKSVKVDFDKYEKLTSTVVIELLKSNKDEFRPEERINIFAELKNVPTMHVKIFEFNSLNYYKKHYEPFKTDVNLDGLITSFEKTVHFNDKLPQKKFQHKFEFPELDDKTGLFIIEFISNGYSSRAIIKKGTLSVIYKQRIAGQIAYILNENREVCAGVDTGIYFEGQYYKADPEKEGRILIPYEKKTTTGNAILVHNGFATLVEFSRFAEKYTLDVSYLLNSESLVMGNQASVIIRPCLKINQRK